MDISHSSSSAWKHGLTSGIIAGIVFGLVEMFGSVLLAGGAFFDPLRMFASIPLQTAPANIGLLSATIAGIVFHLAFSAVLGVVFAFLVRAMGLLHSSGMVILLGTVFGFGVWLLNFYVLAPLLNVTWFTLNTSALLQFFYHTFFFGTVLGFYVAATWVHARGAHTSMAGRHAHA